MKVWVKIPDKPNVKTMVTCFYSLIHQLHKTDLNKSITGIRIRGNEKTLEIEVDD